MLVQLSLIEYGAELFTGHRDVLYKTTHHVRTKQRLHHPQTNAQMASGSFVQYYYLHDQVNISSDTAGEPACTRLDVWNWV